MEDDLPRFLLFLTIFFVCKWLVFHFYRFLWLKMMKWPCCRPVKRVYDALTYCLTRRRLDDLTDPIVIIP